MPESTANVADRPAVEQFVHSIRSDDLPHFAGFLQRIAVFRNQVAVYRLDLILDANVVIRDLLWLARKRTNPVARTELMELMDCEVVRAHAPYYLSREIRANLPEVAEEHGVPLGTLQGLWKEYRKRIRLVPVGGPAKGKGLRDPKDAPYLRLQKKLAYPIASEDPDLPAMGANVVRIQIFAPLRAYSRNAAIEYHFKISGAGSAMMLAGFAQAALALMRNFRNAPKPLIWGAMLLLALAIAHPASRKKIREIASRVLQGGTFFLEAAYAVIGPMIEQHAQAQNKAALHLAQAQAALGGPAAVVNTKPT